MPSTPLAKDRLHIDITWLVAKLLLLKELDQCVVNLKATVSCPTSVG